VKKEKKIIETVVAASNNVSFADEIICHKQIILKKLSSFSSPR